MPWTEFEDVAPPKAKTRPSNEAIESAADKIYEAGKFHSWFKGPLDWRALDPIGKDEFLSIVEKALIAASAIDGRGRMIMASEKAIETALNTFYGGDAIAALGGEDDDLVAGKRDDMRGCLANNRELEARAQSAEAALAELRGAARKLAKAAARLSIAAQTTGGVAGRDEGLCAEIDRLSQPLGVVRALIEKENGDGSN